jgi:quercetin dioxygenase-like cupin family protein
VPGVQVNDRILKWLVGDNGQITSEQCSCCIVQFEPGASAKPPHSHPDCEESIYILCGSGEMLLEGGKFEAVREGSFLLMRKNEIHLLRNTGKDVMKAVCFYSSATNNTKYDLYPMERVERPKQ